MSSFNTLHIEGNLSAEGEMAGLITRHVRTDKGPTASGLLRNTLDLVLESGFPMLLLWGEDHTIFYNDAYVPVLANTNKHPFILGKPAREAWPESWSVVGPLLRQVWHEGKTATFQNMEVPLHRNGRIEKAFWTFSYSPVRDNGLIVGILVVCQETTNSIQMVADQQNFRDSIIAAAPNVIYIYDLEKDKHVFASHQVATILGYAPSEVQASGAEFLRSSVLGEDAAKIDQTLEQLLADAVDDVFEVEYRMRHREGHVVWLHDRSRVFSRNSEGRPVQILGVAADITERKRLEERLARQFEELQMVYDTAPVGLCLLDSNFRYARINQKLAEINGLSVEEHLGRTVREVIPELAPQVEKLLHQFMADGKTVTDIELRGFTKAKPGVERVWNESWHPVKDENGATVAISIVAEEVTERKQAEAALRESEKKFRHLIESNIIGVLFWDLDRGITDANDAFLNMLGYTRSDLASGALHWDKITPEKWRDLDAKGVTDILREGYHQPYEKQYLRKDGTPVDIIIGSSAIPGTANRQGVTFVIDNTERKVVEQALKESEAQLRTLADFIPQIVWSTLPDGYHDFFNKRWFDFTGLSYDETKADGWSRVLHRDDAARTWAVWRESLATGNHYQVEYRMRRADGTYRWLLARAIPVRNSHGEIVRWLGTCTDIHDQKNATQEMEEIVRERTKELQRSNEDLQQFAHVASHDLREPVRKIKTFASMLSVNYADALPAGARKYIEKIDAATERMFAMIEGVLLYASLEAVEMKKTSVNLNHVIENILVDLEVPITRRGASIICGRLLTVPGSETLLYQLFYNLITNSLKFSKPEEPPVIRIDTGYVTATTRHDREETFILIKVEDNGIGFAQSDAERIFTTFSRLWSKDKYEGTGLGLSLCKKIVERHGGTILAEGEVGRGARFVIHLPAGEGDA